MTTEEITSLAQKLSQIEGVQNVRIWDKVRGKERIYFDLPRTSGKVEEHAVFCQSRTTSFARPLVTRGGLSPREQVLLAIADAVAQSTTVVD